jgi:hypothetical protein
MLLLAGEVRTFAVTSDASRIFKAGFLTQTWRRLAWENPGLDTCIAHRAAPLEVTMLTPYELNTA